MDIPNGDIIKKFTIGISFTFGDVRCNSKEDIAKLYKHKKTQTEMSVDRQFNDWLRSLEDATP